MRKNVLKRATAALLGAVAITLAAPALSASADSTPTAAALQSGQKLLPGQSLMSGESSLVMQGDGNLVLYLVGPTGAHGPALWSSGTYGNRGAYAYMQPDGNLVVYRNGGSSPADALWSSRSWGHPGAFLSLYNGTLRVSAVDGTGTRWETHTGVAPTVSQGGWHPETLINSSRNVEPGQWIESNSVWLLNQPDGNLVLYRKRDGAALWSSRTWNHPASRVVVSDSRFDGALRLENVQNGLTEWSIPVKGQSGIYGKVQDDGNFVIYTGSGTALWSTGTWGKA
ncbi:hypothetical protein [Kitasatospora sp. NPDC059571]|uniref:hypothetical protein n=1 Tax=Kitasatospora sp. NPDC059571 TaxID=3346871 RepID=UPI0036A2D622